MAEETKELDIVIKAKDEASGVVESAFSRIKRQAKEMNAEARSSGDLALERMLKGGGALGIVTLLGEGLKKVTGEVQRMSEEFAKGKANAADIAVEIGKSLPVLGGFVEAGESINEILTHQKQIIKDGQEESKAQNDLLELRLKIQKESVKAEEDLADRIRKSKEELAVAQASPLKKMGIEDSGKLADIQAQRLKDQKEYAEKRREEEAKELEAIRKAGETRKKALEDKDFADFGDDGSDEFKEEIERRRGTNVAAFENPLIQDAQKRAKDDIDKHDKGLGEIAANQSATIVANQLNEAKKGVGKFFEELAKQGDEAFDRAKKNFEEKHKKQLDDEAESARLAEEKRQNAHEADVHHAEVLKTIQDQKISSLEEEGRVGNVNAAREAERMKVLEEFEEKRQRILELMENASDIDRESLADEKSRLEAQQKIALDALTIIDLKPRIEALSRPNQYAGFEDFRKTHGIMDAQRERDRGKAQTQIQHLKDIKSGIDLLNEKIPEIPATIFAGGNLDSFDSEFT